jgi:hypothetical protein
MQTGTSNGVTVIQWQYYGLGHLVKHFLKPGHYMGISISKVPHFVQRASLLNAYTKGSIKDQWLGCKGYCGAHPEVFCSRLICWW